MEHDRDATGVREDAAGAPAPEEHAAGAPGAAVREGPKPRATERARGALHKLLVWAAIFLVGVAVGFVPQWFESRRLASALETAHYERDVSRLQSTLGAALAEVDRGNYERARQLTSSFYVGLDGLEDRVNNEAQTAVLEELARGRDEVITLLSRAAPEARSRLAIMLTRYFTAMEPMGQEYRGSLTTSPEDGPPEVESDAAPGSEGEG